MSSTIDRMIDSIVRVSASLPPSGQLEVAESFDAAAKTIRARIGIDTTSVTARVDIHLIPSTVTTDDRVLDKLDAAVSTSDFKGDGIRSGWREKIGGVELTGYFPPPAGGYASDAEAKMEGGASDRFGKPLTPRTLQNFDPNDPSDYVAVATDPNVIPSKTFLMIDGFPGVIFYACDVGGAIKGRHIDICVKDKSASYKVTRSNAIVYLFAKRPA